MVTYHFIKKQFLYIIPHIYTAVGDMSPHIYPAVGDISFHIYTAVCGISTNINSLG